MTSFAIIASPIGNLKLIGSDSGLSEVIFLGESGNISEEIPELLKHPKYQLQEYFTGKRTIFELKLELKGTEFQKRVWKKLLEIPFGKTISYKELAENLGNLNVVRAAASANGKNPIPVIIPCHRVIGSDGSLTGFSGGLERKKWLLEHENPSKQQQLFNRQFFKYL